MTNLTNADAERGAEERRKLVVESADYWFRHARLDAFEGKEYSVAERFCFYENAVNHLENTLIAERRERGLDPWGKPLAAARIREAQGGERGEEARAISDEIWRIYERHLGNPAHANQDRDAFVLTVTGIIKRHLGAANADH